MLNTNDILETIQMINDESLDVRTVTMGISLLDCADADGKKACEKIYRKITTCAKDLVKTVKGNAIVPTYVLEYLLGQYCATNDEATIQTGIETVKDVLRMHYVHRNESEEKSMLYQSPCKSPQHFDQFLLV